MEGARQTICRGGFLPGIAKYRIASIGSDVQDVNIYRLEPLEGKVPQFTAGQWVFLHMLDQAGNSVDKRPYSIASSPDMPYLEFAIDMVHGRFTGKLETLPVGSVIGVEGPQGRMTYEGQKNAAFIGGGTGVAPFIGMLRHIAAKGIEGRFVLFYTTRTRERIIYRDEIERLSKANPGIKVIITLTRETATDWAGECGRINHEMISKHIGKASDFDWWLCGPMELLKSMRICLAGMGADPKRVRMEGWG